MFMGGKKPAALEKLTKSGKYPLKNFSSEKSTETIYPPVLIPLTHDYILFKHLSGRHPF